MVDLEKKEAALRDLSLLSDEQHVLSMTVQCRFCKKPIGEKCTPSLVFPQYPHTPRLQDALVAKGHARADVLALYEF
jgi:hypothetical protein